MDLLISSVDRGRGWWSDGDVRVGDVVGAARAEGPVCRYMPHPVPPEVRLRGVKHPSERRGSEAPSPRSPGRSCPVARPHCWRDDLRRERSCRRAATGRGSRSQRCAPAQDQTGDRRGARPLLSGSPIANSTATRASAPPTTRWRGGAAAARCLCHGCNRRLDRLADGFLWGQLEHAGCRRGTSPFAYRSCCCLDRRRERALLCLPPVWRAISGPAPLGGGEVPQAATGRNPVLRACL
jgi:hypothetical protein